MSCGGGLARVDVSAVRTGKHSALIPNDNTSPLAQSAAATRRGNIHVDVSLFFTHFVMLESAVK